MAVTYSFNVNASDKEDRTITKVVAAFNLEGGTTLSNEQFLKRGVKEYIENQVQLADRAVRDGLLAKFGELSTAEQKTLLAQLGVPNEL